jgi:homoserine kinase
MINELNSVTVFAPATTANLAVGFDILGFPLEGIGDEIILEKNNENQLVIVSIESDDVLPIEPTRNTATVALQAMRRALSLNQGFNVTIKKGIPLGSGLGGSAASAVAAVFALNQFLNKPLTYEALTLFALEGERMATGGIHGDNVVPCLYGGLMLIHSLNPLRVIKLPDIDLVTAFIRPHITINTRDARKALKSEIPLATFINHNANIAAFISAIYQKDYELLSASCNDLIIEPMRCHLIPHFDEVKLAALQQGALACSISGAGPTLFAFSKSESEAVKVASAMADVYRKNNIGCDEIISPIFQEGARFIAYD